MFALRCTAEPGNLRAFRERIDGWLTGLTWPAADREDVVLAVSEAVTNTVDHAYPAGPAGEVDVVGRLQMAGLLRRVMLSVRDWGRWRPAPLDPGYRGHGLTIMRECMDQVHIRRGPQGTLVTLISCAVPLLAASTASSPHPPLRYAPTATTITLPAADRVTGERRHRQAVTLRQAALLAARARSLRNDADAARARAQATTRTSARLLTDSHRLCADHGDSDQAA